MAETNISPFDSLGGIAATGGISAAIGAGSSLIGGLIQQAFAKRNLQRQVSAQKDLTEFNLKKQYDIMLNEMRLKKMGLKNAGISTATMNGQFGGNASVSQGSAGMPQTPNINIDALGAMSQLSSVKDIEASARLKNAEAENKEIENEFAREKYEADAGFAKVQWNLAKETFSANVSAATEEVLGKKATREYTEKQKEAVVKGIEKIGYEISGINIDNQSKSLQLLISQNTSAETINKIIAEAQDAMYTRDVSKLKSTLADLGIIWDADGITNFISVLAQGKADKIIDTLAEGFAQLLSSVPAAMVTVLSAIWDAVTDENHEQTVVGAGSSAGKATRDAIIKLWRNRKKMNPSTTPKM